MKLKVDDNKNIIETDKDFFLVLGTSHTMGECAVENDENGYLNYSTTWVSLLSKKLGIPHVSLAYGGSENPDLLQMLISFFRDNPKLVDRCKFVLGEVRLGSLMTYTPKDILDTDVDKKCKFRALDTPSWKSSLALSDDYSITDTHLTVNNFTMCSEEEIKNKSKNFYDGNPKENEIALRAFLDVYTIQYGTSLAYQKSFYEIVAMYEVVNLRNIPFMWFTFLDYSKAKGYNWYKDIRKALHTEFDYVWDCNLLKDEENRDMLSYVGASNIRESGTRCDCGHLDEGYQPKIAKALEKKINNILQK